MVFRAWEGPGLLGPRGHGRRALVRRRRGARGEGARCGAGPQPQPIGELPAIAGASPRALFEDAEPRVLCAQPPQATTEKRDSLRGDAYVVGQLQH